MLREECGVVAISRPSGDDTAQLAFFGLFALQHRGQEAAGIAVADGHRARVHKDEGLIAQVFTPDHLAPLSGYHAIGHTRYSTTGGSSARNAQPFLIETMHGPLAVAHNGNLVNAGSLRGELLTRGIGLSATSDTEVMAMMLAGAGGSSWEERLARTIPSWQGAFSIVMLVRDGVLAARDPWGFRPLSLGRLPEGGWAVASETCALRTLGCENIREIEPGEVVSIRGEEVRSRRVLLAAETARCTFEFVYFSRPDSDWDGQNVHEVRQRLGARLAKEAPADGDVVVGVPDSSLPAAVGYARESGIPFNEGLVKNRYIARTFIEPTQDMRERRVAMKYNALPSNLAGKRVVMIDDSLVRGTTAGPLVRLLREAGASEVHVRITCPPIIAPCFMGVDMGDPRELAASTRSVEQIRQQIGADSLAFLSLEAMMAAIGRTDGYCNACYTGEYPLDVADVAPKDGFEHVLG